MIRFYAWLGSWSETLGALWRSKRIFMIGAAGQGLVEYAIVITLVAVLVARESNRSGRVAMPGGPLRTADPGPTVAAWS